MSKALSNSILTLLKSKGEMTTVQIELELSEKPAAIIGDLDYLTGKGRVFYRKRATGRFSVRKIYFVVS